MDSINITPDIINEAREIARRADAHGVIHPADMVKLFPGEPHLHTETLLRRAWALALPRGIDLDALSEAVWS